MSQLEVRLPLSTMQDRGDNEWLVKGGEEEVLEECVEAPLLPVPGREYVKLGDPPMCDGDRERYEEFKEKVLFKLQENAHLFLSEAS